MNLAQYIENSSRVEETADGKKYNNVSTPTKYPNAPRDPRKINVVEFPNIVFTIKYDEKPTSSNTPKLANWYTQSSL